MAIIMAAIAERMLLPAAAGRDKPGTSGVDQCSCEPLLPLPWHSLLPPPPPCLSKMLELRVSRSSSLSKLACPRDPTACCRAGQLQPQCTPSGMYAAAMLLCSQCAYCLLGGPLNFVSSCCTWCMNLLTLHMKCMARTINSGVLMSTGGHVPDRSAICGSQLIVDTKL